MRYEEDGEVAMFRNGHVIHVRTSVEAMIRSSKSQDVLIDQSVPVKSEYEGTVS